MSGAHHITIEPVAGRVLVTLGGETIAESRRALALREGGMAPVLYIPRDDVAMAAMARTDRATHCPFKGDASYYTLNMDAQSRLQGMADHLKNAQNAVVQIEGHCDERGSIEYNLALGERRAQSVKNYLVQLGIDAARLSTISYGEEKPATDGHDETAWSKNRRAEFTISNQ